MGRCPEAFEHPADKAGGRARVWEKNGVEERRGEDGEETRDRSLKACVLYRTSPDLADLRARFFASSTPITLRPDNPGAGLGFRNDSVCDMGV